MSAFSQALNLQPIYEVINIGAADLPAFRNSINVKVEKKIKIYLPRVKLATDICRIKENQTWFLRRGRRIATVYM